MLIATISSPSTPIARLICRFWLTLACWLEYLTCVPTA